MARIPPHIIDEIMQTSRIEEVIGEFVHLKRAGSSLKGLSPFTDEKTPSFVVSPAKQIFKCFSTGKGGSVVTFLMEKEHYSYPEALKWLANKYNITLPEEEEQTAEQLAAVTERESLQIINEFAKTHFHDRMHTTEEGKAIGLSYFIERGFRQDIIEKFQLGYCLEKGNDFTEAALNKGYKLEYLEKIGLVKSKDGRNFDFFRGRVMFPIHSVTGRILGFGGRTLLSDKKIAKYFNSPESIIYNKSDILYGLYFSKGDIIKYDNCFLVEGYTDVISMHQAGITNVVSSSGTSLTHGQIKLIRRYTPNVTILYDGDAAGIKASFRGIDLLLEEGLNVRIVLFPDGDDPDSYSKKVSSTELDDYIKSNTKDFVTFKAEILLQGTSDPIQRSKLIHDIVHSISLIPDQISRTVYSKEIANRFDIDQTIVEQELVKLRKTALGKINTEPVQTVPEVDYSITRKPKIEQAHSNDHELEDQINAAEYDLIRILVKYGTLVIPDEKRELSLEDVTVAQLICNELFRDELTFNHPTFQKIYEYANEGINKQKTTFQAKHYLRSEDQDIVKIVSEIETDKHELSHNWLKDRNIDTNYEIDKLKAAVSSSILAFKTDKLQQRINEIRKKISQLGDDEIEKMEELLIDQINYERAKMRFAEQLGRIILR
jgi:DNA primase